MRLHKQQSFEIFVNEFAKISDFLSCTLNLLILTFSNGLQQYQIC